MAANLKDLKILWNLPDNTALSKTLLFPLPRSLSLPCPRLERTHTNTQSAHPCGKHVDGSLPFRPPTHNGLSFSPTFTSSPSGFLPSLSLVDRDTIYPQPLKINLPPTSVKSRSLSIRKHAVDQTNRCCRSPEPPFPSITWP